MQYKYGLGAKRFSMSIATMLSIGMGVSKCTAAAARGRRRRTRCRSGLRASAWKAAGATRTAGRTTHGGGGVLSRTAKE